MTPSPEEKQFLTLLSQKPEGRSLGQTVVAEASETGAPSAPRLAVVNCAGCPGHCCKNDMIVLHPELGDEPSLYQTVAIVHPLTGRPAIMLDHKPNGDCIYLEAKGCSIHGRHPAICRKYDCADQYEKLSRSERRRFVSQGLFSRAQLEQGRRVSRSRAMGARGDQDEAVQSNGPNQDSEVLK